MRILLVEDDEMIGDAIVRALQDAAYATDWVRDADAAIGALLGQEHDVLLLDLNLPNRDGIDVLRALRGGGNKLPVIVLTARDGVDDRIAGLDAGADDYLVKPFEIGELLARLRAVTRRLSDHGDTRMTSGKLTLDAATHIAVYDGMESRLTSREFALLSALLTRPGTVLSRTQLERKLYVWEQQVEGNAVEVLIHGIRKKLGASVIRNVRGVGWLVDKDDNHAL
ncbi:MAG: Two-component system response regulator QseB [uncultured Paraburkholderia sp.]|uniref:response regulator n=1 Tax=uncultured Paraburkholderia sp. TaxID=1822466 RepID=UPI002594F524|nr:response regulator transcription factor [uncultured Paraburkholderia sp.]CAH2901263.1 MAG: Two-component system response regulator QseB [uncultured Paraburkholderia sp.]CAH2916311.1 MAG: Two-component system response regulator QseB [uncultured Paraburkholderia sp.]